jgi:uncharacterized membrane protein YvbJ
MNIKKYLLILLILVNCVLILVTSFYLKSFGEIEARINQIEKQVNNPEVKIIPTK